MLEKFPGGLLFCALPSLGRAFDRLLQMEKIRLSPVRTSEHTSSCLTQCLLFDVVCETCRADASSLRHCICCYFCQLLIFKLFSCICATHALTTREHRKIREFESGPASGCRHRWSKQKLFRIASPCLKHFCAMKHGLPGVGVYLNRKIDIQSIIRVTTMASCMFRTG